MTKTVFRIRICIHPDSHQSDTLDPDPHQSDTMDPDPHQFADDKLICMNYEPIFNVLSLYLEARFRIRVRITVKGRIRIRNTGRK
jgi:hypothetical protein